MMKTMKITGTMMKMKIRLKTPSKANIPFTSAQRLAYTTDSAALFHALAIRERSER
jgi:hypothetical protein